MLKMLATAWAAALVALVIAPPSVAHAQPAGLAPPGSVVPGSVVEVGDAHARPGEVQLDTNPEEPVPYLEEAWALGDALRRLHPEAFGGLWREPEGLVIGVVDDREAIEGSVASLFPDPAFVTYRPVDWSEAALEHARSKFHSSLQELFDEQEVHVLGVDVRRNRVYLETSQHPSAVRWERYVSGVPSSMVHVEQGNLSQLLDGSVAETDSSGGSNTRLPIRLSTAALLVALALAWRERPAHPSRMNASVTSSSSDRHDGPAPGRTEPPPPPKLPPGHGAVGIPDASRSTRGRVRDVGLRRRVGTTVG